MKKALSITTVLLVVTAGACLEIMSRLAAVKGQLVVAQKELGVRDMVWWKLRGVITTYHEGIIISIPDYPGGGAPAGPISIDTHTREGRYEFAADGKSARRFVRFANGDEGLAETWPPEGLVQK